MTPAATLTVGRGFAPAPRRARALPRERPRARGPLLRASEEEHDKARDILDADREKFLGDTASAEKPKFDIDAVGQELYDDFKVELAKWRAKRDEELKDEPPFVSTIEERLAAALAEDTTLPPNPNPIPIPPLPDLRELAKISNLELTDEEIEEWTPQVHGIIDWFGKLNDIDIEKITSDLETETGLYRDDWSMPLADDVTFDFENREAMMNEAGDNWQKPYVRVPKVDVKENAEMMSVAEDVAAATATATAKAAAAAAAGEKDGEAASASSGASPPSENLLGMEFLVGRVLKCEKHPEADKLYVETIDCGEESGPRTICSGLVPYMSAAEIQGKNVVVVANLKPRKMSGIASAGMLLCANNGMDGDDRVVELLVVPEGATPGERLTWEGATNDPPHGGNKIAKKKIWEDVQPGLETNATCAAAWRGNALVSSAGAVTCASVSGGKIS